MAPFRQPARILVRISWAITIRSGCTAITIMSLQRGRNRSGNYLLQCPKILDHYTFQTVGLVFWLNGWPNGGQIVKGGFGNGVGR